MSAALGLVAALVAAVGYGLASVLQAVGARRAAGAPGAGSLGLARQPAYLAGVALDGAAWLVSLVALRTLPLFAVQALLAGSLAVTAVVGARVLGLGLRRADAVALAVAVAGLAAVAAGARPGRPEPAPAGTVAGALALAVLLLVLAVAPEGWLGETARRWLAGVPGAVALATAAGVAYSAAALCARLVEPASWLGLLAEPVTWAVVVAGIAGTLLYGRSLAGDGVVAATAALWVVEVVVGGAAGVLLLGDGVRTGWAVPVVVGVVLAMAACVQLARPAAAVDAAP